MDSNGSGNAAESARTQQDGNAECSAPHNSEPQGDESRESSQTHSVGVSESVRGRHEKSMDDDIQDASPEAVEASSSASRIAGVDKAPHAQSKFAASVQDEFEDGYSGSSSDSIDLDIVDIEETPQRSYRTSATTVVGQGSENEPTKPMAYHAKPVLLANERTKQRPASVHFDELPKPKTKLGVFDMLEQGENSHGDGQLSYIYKAPFANNFPYTEDQSSGPMSQGYRHKAPDVRGIVPVEGQKSVPVVQTGPSTEQHRRYSTFREVFHNDRNQQNILIRDDRKVANSSIHMSLTVEEDIQVLLGETSALRRLGHFTKAIAFYEQRLGHHMQNDYIRVLYAQCLYDAAQYKKLRDFAMTCPEKLHDRKLQLYWKLIMSLVDWNIDANPGEHKSFLAVDALAFECFSNWKPEVYKSVETQILCHALLYMPTQRFESFRFHDFYRHFLSKDLIWEFRDLLYSLQRTFSFNERLKRLLNLEANGNIEAGISILCDDWDAPFKTEARSFAVVEIFTHLALCSMNHSFQTIAVDKCMEVAKRHAEFLISARSANLNTRPCLQWMITRNIRKMYGTGHKEMAHFEEARYYPGILYRYRNGQFPFDQLTLCIPKQDNMPTWEPYDRFLPDKAKRTTRVVLEAAENLGDVILEAACWRQVIYQEPHMALHATDRIIEICKKSGNLVMRTLTTLFQSLLVQDTEAKTRLYDRIVLLTEELDLATIESYYAYAIYLVLASLAPSEQAKENYFTLARDCEEKLL